MSSVHFDQHCHARDRIEAEILISLAIVQRYEKCSNPGRYKFLHCKTITATQNE